MSADLNISLILKLVDQVTAPARGAINAVKRIGEATDAAGRRGVEWSNAQLAANAARKEALQGEAVGVAATGFALYQALKPAIEFETSMSGVKKVLDFDAPDGIAKMQRDILELTTSEGLPMTAQGIAEIIEAAGQAGVVDDALPDDEERAKLIAFARDAAQMGVAFDIAAGQSGQAMAQWRKAMGLTQDEVLDLGDMINHLSNNMNATAPGMVDIIRRQGAVAQAAGLAESEIAALSAAFLSGGAAPEIAATGMKNFLGALTDGEAMTKRQRSVMQDLGFDAVEMSKRMQVDAKGAIIDVMEALAELPEHAQSAALSQLFGEESKGAIAPLLTNVQLLHEAFDLVADPTQYAGSMLEEYKTQAENTANALIITGNYVTGLAVAIGSMLLPELNELLAIVQPVIGSMTAWAAEHPELITLIARTTAGLFAMKVASIGLRWTLFSMLTPLLYMTRSFSWVLILLPRLVAALLALLNPLKLVRTALILLRAAFLASGIGAILAGIAMAGLWIYQNWSGLKVFFENFWQSFRAAIGPAAPLIDGVISKAEGLLGWFSALLGPMDASEAQWRTWGQQAGQSVAAVASRIEASLAPVAEAFSGAFNTVSSMVTRASAALASTFGEGGNGRAALSWLAQLSFTVAVAALQEIGTFIGVLVGHLAALSAWMIDGAQAVDFSFLSNIEGLDLANRATEVIKALAGAVGSVVELSVVSLKSIFGGFFDGFSNYITPILNELQPIAGTLGTIIDDIVAMFRNFAQAAGLISESETGVEGLRILGNVLGHIIGIVGTVAAGSLRAVVTFIGGLVTMIRSLTEGDISGAFQPVIDFVTWLNNLTLDLLLPDFDGSVVAAEIASWFTFDWATDILPEWNWSAIIPDLPDFRAMFSDADQPIDIRLENSTSSAFGSQWRRGAELVEEYRQGLISVAELEAELEAKVATTSNLRAAQQGFQVGRAKAMLEVLRDANALDVQAPAKPAPVIAQIDNADSLLEAAKAAEDLKAELPSISTAADEALNTTRGVLAQIASLLQGTDYTSEGARIGQSIADGLVSKVEAVRAAAAQIGAAIRSALPGSASVDVSLSGQKVQGKRDSGGPVMAGLPYLVGERAPEVFVPGVSGSILPTRVLRAAMAATAIGAPAAASTSVMAPVEAALSAPVAAYHTTEQNSSHLMERGEAHTSRSTSVLQTLRTVAQNSTTMFERVMSEVDQTPPSVTFGDDRSTFVNTALQSARSAISNGEVSTDARSFSMLQQVASSGDQISMLAAPLQQFADTLPSPNLTNEIPRQDATTALNISAPLQRLALSLPALDVGNKPTLQSLSGMSELSVPAQTMKASLARMPATQERLAPATEKTVERATPSGGDTFVFHIAPPAGTPAQDVAREVEKVLRKREQARLRNLHDGVDY